MGSDRSTGETKRVIDEARRGAIGSGGPIPLNERHKEIIENWATDEKDLWSNDEARRINLETFVRSILSTGYEQPQGWTTLKEIENWVLNNAPEGESRSYILGIIGNAILASRSTLQPQETIKYAGSDNAWHSFRPVEDTAAQEKQWLIHEIEEAVYRGFYRALDLPIPESEIREEAAKMKGPTEDIT